MAGSSNGKATTNIIGARVTRKLIYTPGYAKAGAGQNGRVPDKVYIPVAVNPLNGDASFMTLTLWGDKISPIFCHYVRPGKEIHFLNAELRTFKSPMTSKQGRPFMNEDGTPATYDRMSITVREFIWGEDSEDTKTEDAKIAAIEIQQNKRPMNWNVKGHPERQAWLSYEQARISQPYTGGPTFGYADVNKKSLVASGYNAYANPSMINNMSGGMVDKNAGVPNVNGVTYDMLKNVWKMTDEQIMANPMYAPLKIAHDTLVAAGMVPGAVWTPAGAAGVWQPPTTPWAPGMAPGAAGAPAASKSFY